jgi:polysaccharide pyruvyl transferase WcaK-like protein
MPTQATDCSTKSSGKDISPGAGSSNYARDLDCLGSHPRIALLTPYNGGNLGDAAIQDAVIANLHLQLPGSRFSGISLNCENFLERHGVNAFPLCATRSLFYAMSYGSITNNTPQKDNHAGSRGSWVAALNRVAGLLRLLRKLRRWLLIIPKELIHFVRGYRFLCRHDLLVMSGGGQMDEEWGGSWGHPLALCKWALLAHIARIPCAFVSVGAGKVKSPACRLFLSVALRLASYRSYRDENSKRIAATLLKAAVDDPVVPDLAFSLPVSHMSAGASIRSLSGGQTVIAISPIAYAKPNNWPHEDQAVYARYLQQLSKVMSQLVERGYYLVMVCSSLGDDDSVIPQIFEQFGHASRERMASRICVPKIANWKDLAAILQEVDLLIASRLHSVIFSFLARKPAVSISFDPKVDWLMQDTGQTDTLLQIHNFTAADVFNAIERLQLNRFETMDRINTYQQRILPRLKSQYDDLVRLAGVHHNHGNRIA